MYGFKLILNVYECKVQTQRDFKGAPVCLDPRSPLQTDPWLCQASRAASELPPETTPHPTRLCVEADCDPSLPPSLLLPPLPLPLWKHK